MVGTIGIVLLLGTPWIVVLILLGARLGAGVILLSLFLLGSGVFCQVERLQKSMASAAGSMKRRPT